MRKITAWILSSVIAVTSICTTVFNTNKHTVMADTNNWPGNIELYGTSACLIEASTGTVLYEKKAHKKMYPASITKILTALVTLNNCSLDEDVEFSSYAVNSLVYGDANMGMQVGEIMNVEDCLYGLMLQSANEVATALAEHVAGSVENFAAMMNETAKAAGATDSNFVNANGLHDDNHYVTAYDMAMITREAIKNPVFVSITNNTSYTVGKTNKKDAQTIAQRHKMLHPGNPYYYEGVLGGKTGFTDQSGTTLVTFAEKDGMMLISVVLQSNGVHVYEDTTLLLDYGFEHFKLVDVAASDSRMNNSDERFSSLLEPSIGEKNDIELSIDKSAKVVLPKEAKFSDLTSTVSFLKDDEIESSNGYTPIAKIDYSYGDHNVGSANVVYNKAIPVVNTPEQTSVSKDTDKKDTSTEIKDDESKEVTDKKDDKDANNKENSDSKSDDKSKESSNDSGSFISSDMIFTIIFILIGITILGIIVVFIKRKRKQLNAIREMKRRRY